MKKVQLYIDEHKDKILFDLVKKLEKEGERTRGYVTDRLKDRLKTFELLARRFGEDDPTALAIKLATSTTPEPVKEEKKEPQEKKRDFTDEVLQIGKGASFFDE